MLYYLNKTNNTPMHTMQCCSPSKHGRHGRRVSKEDNLLVGKGYTHAAGGGIRRLQQVQQHSGEVSVAPVQGQVAQDAGSARGEGDVE